METYTLQKGANIALDLTAQAHQPLIVSLHWVQSATTQPLAMDASLFLLNAAGVVSNDHDFIFYNQEADSSGAIYRLSAAEGPQPPHQDGFAVTLPALSDEVQRLALCLTLDTEQAPAAAFRAVSGVRAQVLDCPQGQTLCEYRVEGLGDETALIVAEFYRHRGGWKFRAVGQGFTGGLRALAAHFGVLVADEQSPSAKISAPEEPFSTRPLTLDKETEAALAGVFKRRRRTQQDILSAQIEDLKTRYRLMQPLLKRALQDSPNESHSRLLLDRILQDVLGYELGDIKTEQKIKGRFADYVLAVNGVDALVIEAKRLGAPLGDRQIFQANTYAAFSGIRWAVLTNILHWRLYRVVAKDKVEADLVFTVDLQNGLDDENAYRLMLISKAGLARCELLEKLWRKTVALSQPSLVAAILSEDVLNKIRTVLLREHGYTLTYQEIQDAIEREVLR
jgi:stress response protein SCP2/predicted type IV restriction endonuclease